MLAQKQNTLQKLLTRTNTSTSDKFEKCGIYQLTCLDCNKKYVDRQTDLFVQGIVNTIDILNTIVETLNTRNT